MSLRKLLLVTYYFPPCAASGTFRALGFARHLPKFGWQPVVVAPPRIPWEPLDEGLLRQVPPETPMYRPAYPRGRVAGLLQRFVSSGVWWPRALAACAQAVREHRPDAVLTTSPPHGVHLLGRLLNLRHGLPWVADFRDPWAAANWQGGRPGLRGWWNARCERLVMSAADAVIANAPLACEGLQAAYPAYRHKMVAMTNGYDPESFPTVNSVKKTTRLTVVHAGELYAGRDPRPLLDAFRDLSASARPARLYLLGRSEGVGFDLGAEIRQRGLDNAVDFSGQVAYGRALTEMAAADILLLLDTPGRRIGIPAKLYEYLGAARPILALAEPDGDTAWALRESGILHRIAPLTDAGRIRQALTELIEAVVSGQPVTATGPQRLAFTRERLAGRLADCLNACVEHAAGRRRVCELVSEA
ncbi:MAG TPA: glycosyltransferase family 4 protein [Gemmataceae bacterium]|nr:glycosyltransferase family 4 protein [Gemmataceae bacterium]